jgi:hypothetical protein
MEFENVSIPEEIVRHIIESSDDFKSLVRFGLTQKYAHGIVSKYIEQNFVSKFPHVPRLIFWKNVFDLVRTSPRQGVTYVLSNSRAIFGDFETQVIQAFSFCVEPKLTSLDARNSIYELWGQFVEYAIEKGIDLNWGHEDIAWMGTHGGASFVTNPTLMKVFEVILSHLLAYSTDSVFIAAEIDNNSLTHYPKQYPMHTQNLFSVLQSQKDRYFTGISYSTNVMLFTAGSIESFEMLEKSFDYKLCQAAKFAMALLPRTLSDPVYLCPILASDEDILAFSVLERKRVILSDLCEKFTSLYKTSSYGDNEEALGSMDLSVLEDIHKDIVERLEKLGFSLRSNGSMYI